MPADHRVGPGGDRGAGNLALVVGDGRADEMDAPVLRDDHHVGLALCLADVCLHRGKIAGMGIGMDARRGARLVGLDLFIDGMRAHRRAAGAALLGPVAQRQDARIGEHGDAGAIAQCELRRLARLGNIRARARHLHARRFEIGPGLEERRRCPSPCSGCPPSRCSRTPPAPAPPHPRAEPAPRGAPAAGAGRAARKLVSSWPKAMSAARSTSRVAAKLSS